MSKGSRALILGIGNLLWADEGFGVRAVEELHRHYEFPSDVTLMDGGTQGVYLLQHVREANVLVVFDAIDYGLPPGTIKRIEGDAVPKFLGAKKISLHQTGFQEVLAMAEMMGDYPTHLLLVGVQPVELEDYGGSLCDEVKAQIWPSIELALKYLEGFGIKPTKRAVPLGDAQTIACQVMSLQNYESERPSRQQACRIGDGRLLSDENWQGPHDFEKEIDEILSSDEGGAGLMCIGIPMKVVESFKGYAICDGQGERRRIDLQLVGDQPEGTWLLTFLDAAREVITEEDAAKIGDALQALRLALSGDTNVDHLFADLIDREPKLPEHLQKKHASSTTK